MALAAQRTAKEDAPTKQGERTDLGNLPMLPQAERAKANGISPRQQRKLDKLARDFPALHEAVKAGNLSVHRAGIHAGFIKDISAMDQLKRAWTTASPAERATFLAWVADPHKVPLFGNGVI